MMPIVSFWAAVLTALSSVTGLSVVPAGDRTEVVIAVDGPVSVEHFALRDTDRLVVDVPALVSMGSTVAAWSHCA